MLGHRLLGLAQLDVALVGAGAQFALHALVDRLRNDGLDLLRLIELGLFRLNGRICKLMKQKHRILRRLLSMWVIT